MEYHILNEADTFNTLKYRHIAELGNRYNLDVGSIYWLNDDKLLHRENGPAVEAPDGSKLWYQNGELHREDGPAVIEPDGTKIWYLNGLRHREGGPAIEFSDGLKQWYVNGELHREDGPALEWSNRPEEWWIRGKQITI